MWYLEAAISHVSIPCRGDPELQLAQVVRQFHQCNYQIINQIKITMMAMYICSTSQYMLKPKSQVGKSKDYCANTSVLLDGCTSKDLGTLWHSMREKV